MGLRAPPRCITEPARLKCASGSTSGWMKERAQVTSYEDCMNVAAKLTWSTYQMLNAPTPPAALKSYLTGRFGALISGSTRCIVCKDRLNFSHFEGAQRGRALLETAHANPRLHNSDNVGFAHRECNIAQGGLSLSDFYDWIRGIISRVEDESGDTTA